MFEIWLQIKFGYLYKFKVNFDSLIKDIFYNLKELIEMKTNPEELHTLDPI